MTPLDTDFLRDYKRFCVDEVVPDVLEKLYINGTFRGESHLSFQNHGNIGNETSRAGAGRIPQNGRMDQVPQITSHQRKGFYFLLIFAFISIGLQLEIGSTTRSPTWSR